MFLGRRNRSKMTVRHQVSSGITGKKKVKGVRRRPGRRGAAAGCRAGALSAPMIGATANVAAALAACVAPLLGPGGRDVLVASGAHRAAALITGSGKVVLDALLDGGGGGGDGNGKVTNTVARYLFHQVRQHDAQCGDGCSSLVLMVAAGLRHARSASPPSSCSGSRAGMAHRRLLRLATALQWLRRSWVPTELEPALHTLWSSRPSPPRDYLSRSLVALVHTNLASQFGAGAARALGAVACRWLTTGAPSSPSSMSANGADAAADANTLVRRAETLINTWPVLRAPGASLGVSQILTAEVILCRPLFREQSLALRQREAAHRPGGVPFAVVMASFDPRVSSQTMGLPQAASRTKTEYAAAAGADDAWARRCVDAVAARGIALLITTEALPEAFAGQLRRAGILAVDHLDRQQARYLCARAGIAPVLAGYPGAFAVAGTQTTQQQQPSIVGHAGALGRVTLGGVNCVCVRGLAPGRAPSEGRRTEATPVVVTTEVVAGQLLLRAPTSGILREYDRALRRVVLNVRCWLRGKGTHGVTRGGGDAELGVQAWCADTAARLGRAGSTDSSSAAAAAVPACLRPLLLETGGHAMSRAEAQHAMETLAAMAGAVPARLATNRGALAAGAGRAGTVEYLRRLAFHRVALASQPACPSARTGDARITGLCPPVSAQDLTRPEACPVASPALIQATLVRALDIVIALIRTDAVVRAPPGGRKHRHQTDMGDESDSSDSDDDYHKS